MTEAEQVAENSKRDTGAVPKSIEQEFAPEPDAEKKVKGKK